MAKALSNQCPENVSTTFKISNSDKYNLRSNNKMLMLSKPKTNSMKRTFGYAAAKDWNYNTKNFKSTEFICNIYIYLTYRFDPNIS